MAITSSIGRSSVPALIFSSLLPSPLMPHASLRTMWPYALGVLCTVMVTGCSSLLNRSAFTIVIYESTYRAVSYLPDEALQLEALRGLLEYRFYDTLPDSTNPLGNMVFVQAIPCMRNAKERWEISFENGRKGSRLTPISTDSIIRMKQEGMTNKQIADKVGLSEKTIENRITLHNKAHPQKLSVSETECESGTANAKCQLWGMMLIQKMMICHSDRMLFFLTLDNKKYFL